MTVSVCIEIRHDTIRDAILTCAHGTSQLNLQRDITKKWENIKVKTDMLRSIGKQSGKPVESVLEKKKKAIRWEGFAEKVLRLE